MIKDIEEAAKTLAGIFKFTEANKAELGETFRAAKERSESKKVKGWRWKPKVDQAYYYKDPDGNTECDIYDGGNATDEWRRSQENMFETEKLAELDLEKDEARGKLLDLIRKINLREDWEPDFSDFSQQKTYFGYNCDTAQLEALATWSAQIVPTKFHFNPGFALEIIDGLGEDTILKALGIQMASDRS